MLHTLSVAEAAKRIREGSLSPVELVAICLERIESIEPSVKAWVTLCRVVMGGDAAKLNAVLRGNPERFHSPIPLRELATVEEVAAAVAYLASEAAGHVTGHVLAIDGGQNLV